MRLARLVGVLGTTHQNDAMRNEIKRNMLKEQKDK